MEHRKIEALGGLARILPEHEAADPFTRRRARLERFADLLEEHGGNLQLLSRLEFMPVSRRAPLRADGSPLTVAYQDPLFRSEGLVSDRLGDVVRFFDLTAGEMHSLLCDCHNGSSYISAGILARRVRAIAGMVSFRERWGRLRSRLASLWA